MKRGGWLVVLLAAGCVPPRVPSPVVAKASKVVRHASGITFPERIKDYAQVGTDLYSPSGDDMSVGYNCAFPPVATTFFVYPKRDKLGTLKDEFNHCKAEVFGAHTGTKLLGESTMKRKLGSEARTVYLALFYVDDNGGSHSEVFVTEYKDWYILIRSTYHVSTKGDASRQVASFVSNFPWP